MSAKKKTRTCKIVNSLDMNRVMHRRGVTNCPACGHEADVDEWAKGTVILVLETVHGKHGSLAVVSECTKCFEKSWCHFEFNSFRDWSDWFTKELKEAAQAEHTKRHVAAVRRFADSLCAKCEHLLELECDTLPIVKCTRGKPLHKFDDGKIYYHSCFTERKCDDFKARPPTPEAE